MVKPVTPCVLTIPTDVQNIKKTQAKALNLTAINSEPTVEENVWIWHYFKEFSANTALHGFNHIVRNDSTKCERVLWITIVLTATVMAAVLLHVSWQMNLKTPTVTVIESTHYSISNVHFPAVTVCNMNTISAKRAIGLAKNLTKPNHVTSDELSNMFRLILHFQAIGVQNQTEYDLLHGILQMNNSSVVNLTAALKPSCSDMIQGCVWKGNEVRCDEIFQTINTVDGLCCSFNSHAINSTQFHSKADFLRAKNPYRISAVGHNAGLMTIVSPLTDDYHSTFFSGYGVRVLIHDAYDFADDNADAKAISPKMLGLIMVYPETTYSTPEVRRLPPELRNCYFADEHKLSYFQRYSQLNCLAECRSRMAYGLCGCVPYFLPNNGSYRVCEMNDTMCIYEKRSSYFAILREHNDNYTAPGRTESIYENDMRFPCDCLPDCELNQYTTEMTSATLNRTFSKTRQQLYKGINLTDHTSISVFFADLVSTRYRKDVYQNWLSLLASFGGILGLLLSFSFISVFELIYFFTIRVFFDRLKANTKAATNANEN